MNVITIVKYKERRMAHTNIELEFQIALLEL